RAIRLEIRVRGNPDGDEHIPGRTARQGQALSLETNLLTVGKPRRNLDLDFLSGRKPHALGGALGRLQQRDRQRRDDVPALGRRPDIGRVEPMVEAGASARATPEPAHHLAEDVLEAAKSACARAPARAAHAFRAPSESLEVAVAAKSRMPTRAGK